jgi:hypothetical protein
MLQEYHMAKARTIDIDDLKQKFRIVDNQLEKYYASTDRWKVTPFSISKRGYKLVTYNAKQWRYSRLIYALYTNKDIPEDMQIDHINGIRDDDRVENLRIVTNRENAQNTKKYRNGGFMGVALCKNRYHANITINKNKIYLGAFKTDIEASLVYNIACKHIAMYKTPIQFKHLIYDIIHGTQSIVSEGIYDSPLCKYGRYRVYIPIQNKEIYIDSFDTVQNALCFRSTALRYSAEYSTTREFRSLCYYYFSKRQ